MSHNLDNTPKFAGRSSVDWAVKQKLLVGDNRGNWKLNSNLTKQEAIEYLYKLFLLMKESEEKHD